MIKKLKSNFIMTIMVFITVIILSFVTVISVVPVVRERREAHAFLELVTDSPMQLRNDPISDPKEFRRPVPKIDMDKNMFFMSNIAIAQLDSDGAVLNWTSDRQDLYDEAYIKEATAEALGESNDFGVIDGQYYKIKALGDGYIFALIDNTMGFRSASRTAIIAVIAGTVAWFMLLAVAFFIADKATKPVAQAFEKQKQFVADAGHELKTPLAVISANINVIEEENGGNKWLTYIKTESQRMDGLVKSLMQLAEIDDPSKKETHRRFDLSKTVMRAGLPFESLAFEKGTVIRFNVQDDIEMIGCEEQLEQLTGILLSNAVKYGNEKGVIILKLCRERKKITLSVYNTGQGISQEDKNKIFDRFYRVDKARSRESGSYGLGLSIAKRIADSHKAKISVESMQGEWIRFDVVFNQR